MRQIALVFLLFFSFSVHAQKEFSAEAFMTVVQQYHPLARQGTMDVEIAKADLLAARGGFDPILQSSRKRKEFDGLSYYDQQETSLTIPTWYGIDVVAGTESIEGERLNPEETRGRIHYVGFSIPLLRNLVTDKRRAALQLAKNARMQSEVERRIIINDLMQEALKDYWKWFEAWQVKQVVTAMGSNAQQRFGMIQSVVRIGERAAIDTVEAYAQVLMFQQELAAAEMELARARILLSTHLWTSNGQPYDLPEDALPSRPAQNAMPVLDSFITTLASHPELQAYQWKLKSLEVEKRLKFQAFLPQLDLTYNQTGKSISKTINEAWFSNQYRLGIKASVPLRFSEGRGAYRSARLKISRTLLELDYKTVKMQNQLRQQYLEWSQLNNQLQLQEGLVNTYAQLQKGEELRFLNGESSVFLINAREQKTLEGRKKLAELQTRLEVSRVGLLAAAGWYGLTGK